ncbi:MAG: MFS transporter [Alphaproteobacteria bacterium]|nr:MFS transporter [Alphaproteobacteria bacterium]
MSSSSTTNTAAPHVWRGVIMIAILWVGYVNFAMSWVGGSMLSSQIIDYFFGHPVSPIVAQVINYSITTARVIANLLAAIILVKMGPKKAAILALIMLMFSLVAIHMPNYWAYTFARMIMALGGSILVVYVNPVITNYIPQDKKVIAAGFNVLSYNVGAFIASLLFFFFADSLKLDWQLTLTAIASVSVVLLILWLIFAEDFNVHGGGSAVADPTATYGAVIKTSFIWKYTAVFTGFVFLYILALTSLPAILGSTLGLNGALIGLMVAGGAILGTPVGIMYGKKNVNRKTVLYISGFMMVVSMALLFIISYTEYKVMSYLVAFIAGFFMFIQYPIFMNIPHEMKGLSPKKVTIIFGYLWAGTYVGYTLLTIVWSLIWGSYGIEASLVFYVAAAAVLYAVCIALPETNPHNDADKI